MKNTSHIKFKCRTTWFVWVLLQAMDPQIPDYDPGVDLFSLMRGGKPLPFKVANWDFSLVAGLNKQPKIIYEVTTSNWFDVQFEYESLEWIVHVEWSIPLVTALLNRLLEENEIADRVI